MESKEILGMMGAYASIYEKKEKPEKEKPEMESDESEDAGEDQEHKYPKKSGKKSKDYDGDGEVEDETDEYAGVKDKAIKKAMRKEEVEQLDEVSARGQDLAWKTGQAAGRALSRTTDPKKRATLHGLQHAASTRSLGGEYPDTPDMRVGGKPVRKVHDVRRGGTGEGDPDSDRGSGNAANRRTRKEETDLFDYILEHLVAEGYADTNKAALAIMVNMSEEWKQDILTERLAPGTTGVSFTTGRKKGTFDQAMTETNPATGRKRNTSPMNKAIGAHSKAKANQWKAQNEGDHEAAAGHRRRRETIAHVVYNRSGRIIDRADND